MPQRLRNTAAVVILLAGIAWTLPIGPGRMDTDPRSATYSAADPAEFQVTAYRGKLVIVGHARSKHHEQRIIDAVSEHFPAHAAEFEFRPFGVAPAWWDDATVELVTALAGLKTPSANLTEHGLRVRALVSDRPDAEQRLQALRQSMPLTADLDVQLTVINTDATAASFCERQFSSFRAGQVAFAESGTAMRASAYPVLDRVVALADACRAATVTITGHTDSTGNENSNRQLSQARAETVAAYLDSRGIAKERLVVVGAGSSLPIADNATRYGRSINRRIEFEFTAMSD